jgi:hypothetical protein
MKVNYINVLCFIALLFLASCSGSEVYRGNWKAMDAGGQKYEINFEPKNLSIKDQNGKIENFAYTQNSVKIENSVTTYGIHLSNGRVYSIYFPIANDTSRALILLQNNQPLYTISRTSFIQYNELFKLNQ